MVFGAGWFSSAWPGRDVTLPQPRESLMAVFGTIIWSEPLGSPKLFPEQKILPIDVHEPIYPMIDLVTSFLFMYNPLPEEFNGITHHIQLRS